MQNVALLLIAGLSVIAPELVLHSVMPIFTFMSSSVLHKYDEYSVSVIDQTIDQVVPALIQSLHDQKRDVVSGTSELLLSFTAAFEHIPSHRRLRLFHALITKLGTKDFLFAVMAMLANRFAMSKDVLTLIIGLVSDTSAVVELAVSCNLLFFFFFFFDNLLQQTYTKYLDLVGDSLKSKPGVSQVLLGIGSSDMREPRKVAVDLLRVLAHVFKHSSLKGKMAQTFASENTTATEEIRILFSRILEQLLYIGELAKGTRSLNNACGEVLSALFGTLSLVDFLDTIEILLQRQDDELRRKVLRVLESRLRQNPEPDSTSQNRVLDFLPILVQIVGSSPDILLKHAAVASIDRIADKYGRKDPSKVVSAAKIITSAACLGQTDGRIRIMGIFCLTTLVEVLGQALIPALPEIFSRSLGLLESSLNEEDGGRLHDVVYSLLSELFVHVPFMVSAAQLDRILLLSFKSASSDINEQSSDDSREETLRLMATKMNVGSTFAAVDRNWQCAVEAGPVATREALGILSTAIEKHPKSAISKNVGILSAILLKAFGLRQEQAALGSGAKFDASDLEETENVIIQVTISMIYKLNDTTFRPIFVKFVEWAGAGLSAKDALGKLSRLTMLYKFLQSFFGTLQVRRKRRKRN